MKWFVVRCDAENDYGSAWTEGPIIVAAEGSLPTEGEAPDFLEPVRPITVKQATSPYQVKPINKFKSLGRHWHFGGTYLGPPIPGS